MDDQHFDGGPSFDADEDRLLTQEEAAKWLRCDSVRAIRTERTNGRLGWVKVAGKVRIPMSEIQAYLARNKVSPCPVQENRPASSGSTQRIKRRPGTSSITTERETGGVARTLRILKQLKESSKAGSKT